MQVLYHMQPCYQLSIFIKKSKKPHTELQNVFPAQDWKDAKCADTVLVRRNYNFTAGSRGDGQEVIPSALLKEKLPVFSSRKGMAEVATELYSTLSLTSHCSCGQPNASFLLQTFIITVEKWQIGNNRTMLKCLRLWYCSNLTIKEKSVSSHKHRRNSHPKNGVS